MAQLDFINRRQLMQQLGIKDVATLRKLLGNNMTVVSSGRVYLYKISEVNKVLEERAMVKQIKERR